MALQLKPRYLNGGVSISETDFMQTCYTVIKLVFKPEHFYVCRVFKILLALVLVTDGVKAKK